MIHSSKQEIINDMNNQGICLPYSEDLSIYNTPLSIYGRTIPNRIGIQPLEGFDSEPNGAPSDMVYRRYLRFVKGGAGLIWFEACSVCEDGKCNPNQMSLTDKNVDKLYGRVELYIHSKKIIAAQEFFIASDITALLEYTNKYYLLEENETAIITKEKILIIDSKQNIVHKKINTYDGDKNSVMKNFFIKIFRKKLSKNKRWSKNYSCESGSSSKRQTFRAVKGCWNKAYCH